MVYTIIENFEIILLELVYNPSLPLVGGLVVRLLVRRSVDLAGQSGWPVINS